MKAKCWGSRLPKPSISLVAKSIKECGAVIVPWLFHFGDPLVSLSKGRDSVTPSDLGIKCPECGSSMVLRTTKKFTYKNGDPRKFYGCSRWPECRGTHGAHPDGEPLGTPADDATKQARIVAHAVFDEWWRNAGYDRGKGYARLKERFGFEVHIGAADKAMCDAIVRFCTEYTA